jgi:hypothetical protein
MDFSLACITQIFPNENTPLSTHNTDKPPASNPNITPNAENILLDAPAVTTTKVGFPSAAVVVYVYTLPAGVLNADIIAPPIPTPPDVAGAAAGVNVKSPITNGADGAGEPGVGVTVAGAAGMVSTIAGIVMTLPAPGLPVGMVRTLAGIVVVTGAEPSVTGTAPTIVGLPLMMVKMPPKEEITGAGGAGPTGPRVAMGLLLITTTEPD